MKGDYGYESQGRSGPEDGNLRKKENLLENKGRRTFLRRPLNRRYQSDSSSD